MAPMEGLIGTDKEKSPKQKQDTMDKEKNPNQKQNTKLRATLKGQQVGGPKKILKRLVGCKCTASVAVSGVESNCLIDTGSQVTTVSQSFYDKYLSGCTIEPVNNILEVDGANGQPVPYNGYVEISMKFPKEFIAAEPEVQTLALVVPDNRSNSSIQVLIGTNTLDPLYEEYCDDDTLQTAKLCGYAQVLKALQTRHQQYSSGTLGHVRLRGSTPEVIPAGQKVLLQGFVGARAVCSEEWALLEESSLSNLPGGIFIDRCLITIPKQAPYKVPVILRNESDHDIMLSTNCVVAELTVAHELVHDADPDKELTYLNEESSQSDKPQYTACISSQQELDASPKLKFNFDDSPVPEDWKVKITQELSNYADVFAQHELDFGHATKVKHHIKMKDDTPFKQRSRPIHPQDYEAVRRHLQTLLKAGVIRESESPFSSPIVVVRKKNGDIRLCVDYRKLNLQTIRDAYALPNLEESFSALAGAQWFTVMDLKSGYYQIEMEESDKQKTAFVCPLGFYEWNRMPQGITNAPSTFQRLMEKCMGDIHLREALVFLDDIIVFSDSLEEHEARLLKVLNRLREHGLKLSPEKCQFFQTSVRYLGHIVSRDGIETDPEKVKALKTWPLPRNLKELKSFLGFSGYYRRFVQDYARIVKPLNSLTAGYPPTQKGRKRTKVDSKYFHPKEPFAERWTPACQQAFEEIIDKLTSAPVLGYANTKLPYVVHTDASTTGLGAALYQVQDGQTRVIAYASRGLSCSEAKYPAHKLEFLALKWAITDKFHDYLYGNTFTVVTDNNPLRYILTTAKLDAASYRWLAELSTFTFDITYRAGKQNQDADALSRRPHGELVNDDQSKVESQRIHTFTSHHLRSEGNSFCPTEAVKAACQSHIIRYVEEDLPSPCLVESLAIHPEAIPAEFEEEGVQDGLLTVPRYSKDELAKLQRTDPVISQVIELLESGKLAPASLKSESPESRLVFREMSRLELKDGLLYRRRQCDNQSVYQLALPNVLKPSVLTSLHDEMGHMGVERTLELARSRFYWPRMAFDIETKVKQCERCVRRKSQPEKAAPLVNIQTSRPLELVCMDFLSLEPDSHNTKDILVITDHFTKYAVAIPTKDQKASTVAKCLWEQFLSHYGFPERLHSDQGRDFESQTIKELCALAGIRKVRTSPYHPRGNPVERFNRTLLSMLGTQQVKEKTRWREHVKPLAHAYNCTKNDVTGFSPYELMFGRQPRLPIDIAFGLPVKDSSSTSHSQYVKSLKSHLKESYQLAIENSKKVADKNKKRFDARVREATLETGDRVLVRNLRLRSKHKLADRWEPTVYVVQKRAGELPVYTVCPEGQDGPLRTLHRDLLLPCGFLSEPAEEMVQPKSTRRPRTRQTSKQVNELPSSSEDEEENELCFHSVEITETRPSEASNISESQKETSFEIDTLTGIDTTAGIDTPFGTGNLPELEPVEIELVEKEPVEGESVEKGSVELETEGNLLFDHEPENGMEEEKDANEMEKENIAIEAETGTGELTEQLETSGGTLLTEETERAKECVPIANPPVSQSESQRDALQPATISGTNPAVETKNSNHEETVEPPRRSERVRKAPGKFTYPQLGNPFISFVQNIVEGFNQALVETFESN